MGTAGASGLSPHEPLQPGPVVPLQAAVAVPLAVAETAGKTGETHGRQRASIRTKRANDWH